MISILMVPTKLVNPGFPKINASVRILFFKKNMTEKCFVNCYQSKNHKKRYKINKLLRKIIEKCQIKTPIRALKDGGCAFYLYVGEGNR